MYKKKEISYLDISPDKAVYNKFDILAPTDQKGLVKNCSV
jgi:hypothetical protein